MIFAIIEKIGGRVKQILIHLDLNKFHFHLKQ